MAGESIQKKLDRVRPPRVQIKYEVEIGDALELKELPFVVGVLGDYSGKPDEALPPVKDRRFVNIDRDNFNDVLREMKPRLAFRVEDKITGNTDQKLNVELRFNSIDDFSPENVVKQVEPLRKLAEKRHQLEMLKSKMDGNDKLATLLEQVLNSADSQQSLAKEMNLEAASEEAPKGE
ncbi:MAG TPA: type VI secretion system contractile sheath small subunit [Pirellulaceae bacterium]|jgi:type VI secretion system protein ImpB